MSSAHHTTNLVFDSIGRQALLFPEQSALPPPQAKRGIPNCTPTQELNNLVNTHILQCDDIWVLPVPQEYLDLLRGVSLALVNDLLETHSFHQGFKVSQ